MVHKLSYGNKFLKVVMMGLIVLTTFWSSPVSAQSKIDPRVLQDTGNGQTAHFLVYLSQQAHPGERGSRSAGPGPTWAGRVRRPPKRGRFHAACRTRPTGGPGPKVSRLLDRQCLRSRRQSRRGGSPGRPPGCTSH